MPHEGTVLACRAALFFFALVFLVCAAMGCSPAGAALRGGITAAVVFCSVKVLYHLFFNALVAELSDFLRKEKGDKGT